MKKYVKMKEQPLSRDSAGERFALLASHGEVVFHARDLANFWGIRNSRTLYVTLSRYVKAGLLYRVHKGMYSIKPLDTILPYLMGVKAVHAPVYVSCESVLFEKGIINQPPVEVTLVSSTSKRFKIGRNLFYCRKLKDVFLFNDAGIELNDNVRVATLSRAIADMLYFNSKKYFDAPPSMIDWNAVQTIADTVGYTISIPKHI